MHIRVRTNQIIDNELIIIEIYNSKQQKLVRKTINPKKAKNHDKSPNYIFQIDVKMKGKHWKVGEIYTLKTKYIDHEVLDTMHIAKRKPVIQTDKSVYIIGSDIIVTVIAPDLDKNNQKPETIGNKSDHCLTISSSCGKLKNHKLIETGDSTGIFQGVVGTLPAYSGSGKKSKVNRPRGTGPTNGYIPVRLGDELIFDFKSSSGNSKLSAFSSNFGISIELDQKQYCPTDKVYLTVVAPDFNYDSYKIDSIGNKRECKLTISTSVGILKHYKLVETGKDTGIFTGEIVLTGMKNIFNKSDNQQLGRTSGHGPTGGKLACSSHDKLSIILSTEFDEFLASANIRFNIGEIIWNNDDYSLDSLATLRIIDPDMNLNPNKRDSFNVRVWSDSDLKGIILKVVETNEASGIFESSLHFGNSTVSNMNRLHAKKGDTIFAKYEDWTLPKEFSKNKPLEIIAISKIQEKTKKIDIIHILKDASIPHHGKYLDHEEITIKAGEKISWINDDCAAHTVTSGTPDNGPDGKFDSSLFIPESTYEMTFNEKGIFHYYCLVHPWKIGKIIVT
jgi:hypothetical protein